jgi:hypothetical protein
MNKERGKRNKKTEGGRKRKEIMKNKLKKKVRDMEGLKEE